MASFRSGAALAALEVSRGAAFGDIDNDGDTDVIVGNHNGPLRLLLNDSVKHTSLCCVACCGAARERTLSVLLFGVGPSQ